MTKESHQHRKDEHLSLAAKFWREKERVIATRTDPAPNFPFAMYDAFDGYDELPIQTFPELSIADIDSSVELFDHHFTAPFYIEAMTGGSEKGDKINAQLTEIAADLELAMAVGSQSIALKYPELAVGFRQVRKLHPKGFLFANLGAGHSLDDARQALEMLEADALELHVNAAQELSMRDDEGDRDFQGWLENIDTIAAKLEKPVIVKEVGFGMAEKTLKLLNQTHVAAINVGGSGGTNFAWIEKQRNPQGIDLTEVGTRTLWSLWEAREAGVTKPLIATGGIRQATDIAKALSAGATLTSSAGRILHELISNGPDATHDLLVSWKSDIQKLFLLCGAKNLQELQENAKS